MKSKYNDGFSEGDRKINRDSSHVNREYNEQKWPLINAEIKKIINAGERNLSRAFWKVVRHEIFSLVSAPSEAEGVFSPVLVRYLDDDVHSPWLFDRSGRTHSALELISKYCPADADAIVEIGSGWGKHIIGLWLMGGAKNAKYYSCEFTENGRLAATTLAELEEEFSLESIEFDIKNPNYAFLKGHPKNIFVFSIASIEQVSIVPEAFITDLVDIGAKVTGVHLEPIGWQMVGARDNDKAMKQAQMHDYNINYWDLLSNMSEREIIQMVYVAKDVFGARNTNYSAVVWQTM